MFSLPGTEEEELYPPVSDHHPKQITGEHTLRATPSPAFAPAPAECCLTTFWFSLFLSDMMLLPPPVRPFGAIVAEGIDPVCSGAC